MAALDPITAGINLVSGVIDRIFPGPEQQAQRDQAKLAVLQLQQSGELAQMTAQTDINKVEAASGDPLQHWRGALGWVCVAGYAWNFVVHPLLGAVLAVIGKPVALPTLDMSELSTLTLGMLGLGAMHVVQTVKGASK